ncbi:MAG: T9SS type A sorting domain-containing protein [Candidatus Marinimicrobia bacterium]|nr:T9SS type A sorting domain-containing protein [Candidatus Neomarinimicrobiota bacterium]
MSDTAFLLDQGYDHIGDIAYFEGKIYAPIEDVAKVKPIIGIYDADDLEFTGEFVQVPQSHFPWIAVDPRTGYFYSSEFNNVNKLFVYDSEQDFKLIDEVILNEALFRVQGGAFHGDFLYLACDNGDYVYEVDVASETITHIITVPIGPEMEGIEAYELDSGVLHFVAETGGSTNIFYHYDKLLAHDVRVSSIISPEPKMPILGKITPVATVQNIGTNTEQTFNVTCVIDTAGFEIYRDTKVVTNIPSLGVVDISFATWVPKEATEYNFIFFTELSSDLDAGNDTVRLNIEVSNIIDDFDNNLEKWDFNDGWILSIGRNNTNGLVSNPRPYENNTDNAIRYLTHFNLESVNSASVGLWTKNRLEDGKDFLYVEASTDQVNWFQLGSLTGQQLSWVQTFFSLQLFCGKDSVFIRFHLITDSSGTDSGIRIDDMGLFSGTPTLINGGTELPQAFELFQNYPNPFNAMTTIEYELPENVLIELSIYSLLGRKIYTLVDENQTAGRKKVQWAGEDDSGKPVCSGIYFYVMKSQYFHKVHKLILLK